MVIVSKKRFGSVCSLASLCHSEKNCMGFSGGFAMYDKSDDAIS